MNRNPPALVLHARLCLLARSRWHALLAGTEGLHSWFGPRVVTTWLLALVLVASLSWLSA
jgi:hypothetical protein